MSLEELQDVPVDDLMWIKIETISADISNLAKDILEGLQQGDAWAITLVAIVWCLALWVWVFGIYFLSLIREKWFWWAIWDLEENYPMDPQQARLLREIQRTEQSNK